MTDAFIGHGVEFGESNAASPLLYPALAEVLSIGGPSIGRDTVDATHAASTELWREYIAGLKKVVEEAYENPELVKNAPHRSVVHKINTDSLDDPARWAITWRAYLKKKNKTL